MFNCSIFIISLCVLLGTFGQVLECWDLENQEAVAIKIVRSLQKYREAAMIEIDVLQRLGKHDFTGSQ
jgi:dual-specificity kinase